MKQNKIVNVYLSILLFLLVCYRALYQYIHIDGDGRIITSVSVLSVIYLGVIKNTLKREVLSFPVVIWGVLMLYQIVNAFVRGTYEPRYNQIIVSLQELCIMTIVAFLFGKNKRVLFVSLILSLFFYLYVAKVFCSTDDEATGGRLSGFIYTTQLGQLSGFTCIVISLFVFYLKKPPIYLLLYIFPFVILLLTQSRNGLWPVVFSILILLYSQLVKFKLKNLIFYGILIYVAVEYFQSTTFFERIMGANDSYASSGLFYTGTILDDIFADRAIYYFLGYFNFMDHPLFGIGLFNFANYNHFEYMLHSEVLVHVVEGGVIGTILYFSFIGYYFKNLFKHYLMRDIERNCLLLSFLPLFIISFTARIYQYPFFFIIYGLLTGYILQTKKK